MGQVCGKASGRDGEETAPGPGNAAVTATKKVAFLGAGGYMGGPVMRAFKSAGYKTIALVRSSTSTDGISSIADEIFAGDLGDVAFVEASTKGCVAIINFINALMPPKDTMKEQLDNDVPPIQAGLLSALKHDAVFVHTSGNFAIPTKGRIGARIANELVAKPDLDGGFVEHWDTFGHEGGMAAVSMLAEAKHRQEWLVQDFLQEHPRSKACVVIPAGVYGPGVGGRFSFWDLAAGLYLQGNFGDFMHSFIHVEDTAKVYLKIVESGKPGGRYPMYGENMSVRDFVVKYAAAAGVPFVDGPKISSEEAARVYDDSFTRSAFGISFDRKLDSSFAETIEYLKQHGVMHVKPPST